MNEAEVQDTSAKSTNAVVPDNVTVGEVKALPPAEYAVPDAFVASFDVEYAVVAAPKFAEEV